MQPREFAPFACWIRLLTVRQTEGMARLVACEILPAWGAGVETDVMLIRSRTRYCVIAHGPTEHTGRLERAALVDDVRLG